MEGTPKDPLEAQVIPFCRPTNPPRRQHLDPVEVILCKPGMDAPVSLTVHRRAALFDRWGLPLDLPTHPLLDAKKVLNAMNLMKKMHFLRTRDFVFVRFGDFNSQDFLGSPAVVFVYSEEDVQDCRVLLGWISDDIRQSKKPDGHRTPYLTRPDGMESRSGFIWPIQEDTCAAVWVLAPKV